MLMVQKVITTSPGALRQGLQGLVQAAGQHLGRDFPFSMYLQVFVGICWSFRETNSSSMVENETWVGLFISPVSFVDKWVKKKWADLLVEEQVEGA